MAYLALLGPVVALAGLPLIDRLERWAVRPDRVVPPADQADVGPSAQTGSGRLG